MRRVVLLGVVGLGASLVLALSARGDESPPYNPPMPATVANFLWSPDGTKIAFTRDYGSTAAGLDRAALFVMNADGTGEKPLARSAIGFVFAWSPDSSEIAFAVYEQFGLYVVSADGSGLRKVADSAYTSFAWSPDGTRLAYSDTAVSPGIHVVRAEGGDDHVIVSGTDPEWSPDGNSIAFVAGPYTGEIEVVRSDGSNLHSLGMTGITLRWSPDGTRIAWVETTRRDGPGGIPEYEATYAKPVAGGPEVFLGNYANPLWSPKGDELALSSMWGGGRLPHVENADGSGGFDLPGAGSPRWSPDGRELAFTGNPNADDPLSVGGVVLANADGTDLRVIAPGGDPQWSPRGREVAFIGDGCGPVASSNIGRPQLGTVYEDGGGRVYLTPCQVELGDYGADPRAVTIRAYESLTWTNGEADAQGLVFGDAGCNARLASGERFTCSFDSPGTYSYRITNVPPGAAETGTIRVLPPTRTIGAAAAAHVVVYGQRTALFGGIQTDTTTALPNERVTVLARDATEYSFNEIRHIQTRPDGTWSLTVAPRMTTAYRADWSVAHTGHVFVAVRPRVTLVRTGPVTFAVRLAAARSFAGRAVVLQRLVRGRWQTIARARLGTRASRLVAKLPRGRYLLRALVPRAVAGYATGISTPLTLRVG